MMLPFANIAPGLAVIPIALMMLGVTGMCTIARTLYLALRQRARVQVTSAIVATASFLLAIAGLLILTFGVVRAIEVLCLLGTTDMLVIGTPLARFHFLVKLDPAVKARVEGGAKSWYGEN